MHTAQGIQDLVKIVFDFLPSRQRLRLRADAGFYDGDFIVFLEENHCVFTIVAHLTPPLKEKIGGLRYKHVTSEYSCSEFNYQPYNWQAKERFVVLRRKLPDEPENPQTTLFTLDRYAYSVIVTNLDLEPYNVFQLYQDRSAMDRVIRTLKEDYPFGDAPTNSFMANALYAELSLLAYNIVTWFKRLCLPDDWQSFTLPTIRNRLLMMPGEFTRTQNVPTLRFPKNSLYQDAFHHAQAKINKLAPLS